MIIVGGAYWESIRHPKKSNLYGSGLKGAMAMSRIIDNLKLVTVCSDAEEQEIKSVCNTYGIDCDLHKREVPIEFLYLTPMTVPRVLGVRNQNIEFEVEGDFILSYGMLEAHPKLKAKRIVLDPQKPKQTLLDLNSIKCDEIVLVLNSHESAELTGFSDPEAAADELLKNYSLFGVIIKCGAIGALAKSKTEKDWVGVRPSQSVWPVGSGDIFSAAFAVGWGKLGKSILEAADYASKAVNVWTVNPDVFPLDKDFEKVASKKIVSRRKPKIYLAGPFFNLSQLWLIETTYSALLNLGCEVFSPYHNVGLGGDEVAKKDLDGLDTCNSMIALLDGKDEGTIFEAGYAISKNIQCVGYCSDVNSSQLKMIRGSGINLYSDLSTAIYKSIWGGML